MDVLEAAVPAVRRLLPAARPRAALILGSGWGQAVAPLTVAAAAAYRDIPGLGRTGVAGHDGRLLSARAGEIELLIFQGRRHWYEGEGWEPVALPVYLARALGASVLLLTNASGALRADLDPGTLLVLDDHINAMGANPLVGPHQPCWGPRFPDLSAVYDPALRGALDGAAARAGLALRHGVYVAVSGPSYETPAEVAAYRARGGDAVGMSTVPEAILGHAAGLRVAAVSCITNAAAGLSDAPLTHEDVVRSTQTALPRMQSLLQAFWPLLAGALEQVRAEA